jgi:hypothetical protein
MCRQKARFLPGSASGWLQFLAAMPREEDLPRAGSTCGGAALQQREMGEASGGGWALVRLAERQGAGCIGHPFRGDLVTSTVANALIASPS